MMVDFYRILWLLIKLNSIKTSARSVVISEFSVVNILQFRANSAFSEYS